MWLELKKGKERRDGRKRDSPTSALKRIHIAPIYSKSSCEGVEKLRLAPYPISHNTMDTGDLKLYIFPFSLIIIIDTDIHYNNISPQFSWRVLEWEFIESYLILSLPLMTLTLRNVISLKHVWIAQKNMKFRDSIYGLKCQL